MLYQTKTQNPENTTKSHPKLCRNHKTKSSHKSLKHPETNKPPNQHTKNTQLHKPTPNLQPTSMKPLHNQTRKLTTAKAALTQQTPKQHHAQTKTTSIIKPQTQTSNQTTRTKDSGENNTINMHNQQVNPKQQSQPTHNNQKPPSTPANDHPNKPIPNKRVYYTPQTKTQEDQHPNQKPTTIETTI